MNCASCHGTAASTDPSGWSRDLGTRSDALSVIDLRVEERGTAWDNSPVEEDARVEERGHNWGHSEDVNGGTPMPASGCVDCINSKRWMIPRWVASPAPSGLDQHTWKGQNGGKPQPLRKRLLSSSRTLARRWIPRWVSSPYVSAVDGGGKNQDGGKPTPLGGKPQPLGNEKLRMKRTEDSKGGFGQSE